MECNFVVGQKVVCVDADVRFEAPRNGARVVNTTLGEIVEGKTYTIRSVFWDELWECVLVRLEEVRRGNSRYKGEYYESGYDPRRFRPVKTRSTDISIFKAMLTPSKEQVSA
ncbi:hypothetical protein [Agrobacterium sp. 10MFCol1.1]|uniref:hypothetical protein n=1 Tax=Agrobacterium sp. 10MFCol1.1 TaxID=1150775 RepID=UPI0003655EBA|nr:hypothetical protein [Agrobacterium sp. 10MFCol1.1]